MNPKDIKRHQKELTQLKRDLTAINDGKNIHSPYKLLSLGLVRRNYSGGQKYILNLKGEKVLDQLEMID